ncbi:MAG: hopanoid biosynthesis-associated protein HpnK [Elusimicrobia bacterium]|nr:hopanoid biosynthesis-associated protein HpnK [Elusimicrobiota bacterium]
MEGARLRAPGQPHGRAGLVRRLVVTADDFGLSSEVNAAVLEAYRHGILSAASLMAGGPAFEEAVALAKAAPGLAVGLHLALVEADPVLPPRSIPDLVDARGRLRSDLARVGAAVFFSPRVRAQAEAECRAQFERFASSGLPFDHVNGHNHFHIHPTVAGIVCRLAREFRVPAVRVPAQSWRGLPWAQAGMAAVMAPWTALARRRFAASGLACNDALYGLFETGAMDEAAWLSVAGRLGEGVTEVYCHPATATRGVLAAEMPGYRHADELAALLSGRVRDALERAGAARMPFAEAVR